MGYPHDLGWGTLPDLGWGIPPRPGMGTPPPDLGQGTPNLGQVSPSGPGTGYPPNLVWIRQSSTASTCYTAGSVPLAFTQEDFLVRNYTNQNSARSRDRVVMQVHMQTQTIQVGSF